MKEKKEEKGIRIIHNKKIFYMVVILAILLIITMIIISFNYQSQVRLALENSCITDEDCVKQKTTCCSCNNGGEESCVNKINASLTQEILKDCGNVYCTQVFNCNPKRCGCIDGKCSFS